MGFNTAHDCKSSLPNFARSSESLHKKKRVEDMLRRVLIGIAQAWSATGKIQQT